MQVFNAGVADFVLVTSLRRKEKYEVIEGAMTS